MIKKDDIMNAKETQHKKAVTLWELGYNLIPIGDNKVPIVQWKEFQNSRIPFNLIQEWANLPYFKNWGLLTGYNALNPALAIICLDTEDEAAEALLLKYCPETPVIQITGRSGGMGRHRVYRRPIVIYLPNRQKTTVGGTTYNLDVRGDGGYFLAPCSIHPNTGNPYQEIKEWTQELMESAPVYDLAWIPLDRPQVIKPEVTLPQSSDGIAISIEERINQAQKYLAHCPGACQGKGADGYCFAIAATLLHGYALPEDQAEDLLYDWGQRDDQTDEHGSYYPWKSHEITHKIRDAVRAIYNGRVGDKLNDGMGEAEAKLDEIVKPIENKLPSDTYLIDNLPKNNIWRTEAEDYLSSRKLPADGLYVCTYGDYKARVIIPYYDSNGKLIYFNGINMNSKGPRYLGPDKNFRDVLYAPNWPANGSRIYLTEDELDALTLKTCDFNGVACGGKYLSDKQIELIRGYKVCLSLNEDAAGFSGIMQMGKQLISKQFSDITFVRPPKGIKDWNKMLVAYKPEMVVAWISMHEKPFDEWTESILVSNLL